MRVPANANPYVITQGPIVVNAGNSLVVRGDGADATKISGDADNRTRLRRRITLLTGR